MSKRRIEMDPFIKKRRYVFARVVLLCICVFCVSAIQFQSYYHRATPLGATFVWAFLFIIVCFHIFSEEKGIPVDADLGTASGTSSSSLLPSGTALAGTTSTARQNTSNPLNGMPFSQRYHTLYRKRITLPVFEYRADFMRLLAENQCIVLVGEVST